MPEVSPILGVVLAGGKSLRMGTNKALLSYKGRPMVEHMLDLLRQSGVTDTVISGRLEGYAAVEDDTAFSGPAQAMLHIMRRYPDKSRFLFVPVDMPLLTPELVSCLLAERNGAYFENSPLPTFVVREDGKYPSDGVKSVGQLLRAFEIPSIPLPPECEDVFRNINTPQEWQHMVQR